MRTTIKDIAKKTGLSVTTVSLVLNGKPNKIPQRTRELVLSAARELHYRPNQLAVGLVKRQTRIIGVVVPDITNPFFARLVKAIEDKAAQSGFHIILCNSWHQRERDAENIEMLLDKGVDGILYLFSSGISEQEVEKTCMTIRGAGIPVVLIDHPSRFAGASSVSLDNQLGGYIAVRHLLDEGHRQIGFITGPKHSLLSTARLKGAKKALREEELPFHESMCFEGDYQFDSGALAADYFLQKNVTAVFSFNDMMALSFIRRTTEAGRKIPADLSIIGFDDEVFCQYMAIPLTTVRQPVQEMGEAAARAMIELLSRETECIQRVFLPNLVVRASTAPPAHRREHSLLYDQ